MKKEQLNLYYIAFSEPNVFFQTNFFFDGLARKQHNVQL